MGNTGAHEVLHQWLIKAKSDFDSAGVLLGRELMILRFVLTELPEQLRVSLY